MVTGMELIDEIQCWVLVSWNRIVDLARGRMRRMGFHSVDGVGVGERGSLIRNGSS